ncbi:hypothetical protein SCLCIDRAFT_31932 [Scleroderma citrinum Foug A]|uniref:Uncharacterized protein n=1 Tax=Scleroderma citrinum Foug A TaxID=1036808 RepID=A0A0C2YUQ5_9AGAM|nr:hypothetical protein SCLCIDRAFT_31932 [Scleroderma citrinum Foug A]
MRQKWTVKPRSDEYWIEKITEKFNQIKTHVNRAKSHVLDDLSVETSTDVAARLADERDKVLMKARRDMWRQTKYHCCKEITEALLAVKEAKGNDDAVAW